jgi:hypothetical protein
MYTTKAAKVTTRTLSAVYQKTKKILDKLEKMYKMYILRNYFMNEKNKVFFKDKKFFLTCIFLLIVTMPSFADINIIWSTVKPTVEGVNTRFISKSSVKIEFLRSWDEYAFILFTDRNSHNRVSYAMTTEHMIGLVPLASGFRQFSNWLNSDQNFVFAYSSETASDIIVVCIATRYRVYEIIFNNSGNGMNTNNMGLISAFEKSINGILDDINEYLW